ncbi:MAG: SGNH hydrolase domain-containing protein, partial [Solirubrobacteraceae bacterium]
PCSNPTLSVFPTVEEIDADYVPGSPCRPVAGDPAPICAFGVSRAKARRHFALIGDSHALHWRRAVDVVALAERWRGFSITTAACPFSAAVDQLPQGLRALCQAWYRSALEWFDDHPEVSTVLVSAFAPLPVEVRGVPSGGGREVVRIKVAGYRRAWRALPRTVKHVVVVRDVPMTSQATFDCVQRVIAEGTRPPGPACTESRAYALRWDTAVSAARTLRSRRYQSVDLTGFFCRRSCDPVIGGARVYRDPFGHITTAYSRTLGPYLHRKVRRLMRSW